MATAALQIGDSLDHLPLATAPAAKRQDYILLVEDSEDAMLFVRYALERYGNGRYRLEWAKGLSDGLDQLSKDGADLVVLELGLPDSSGPQSYAWVRECAPSVPVVVLTGDTRETTEFEVIASGAENYLVKDQVSAARLVQAIDAALSSRMEWNPKTAIWR